MLCETSPIRLLALVEGETVSGPAKNLLKFCDTCQELDGSKDLEVFLAPFERMAEASGAKQPTQFAEAALRLGKQVHSIQEHFRFDPRVIGRLREIVEQVDPHLVQTHHSKSHFLMRISGAYKTRPWIAFHHGHTQSAFRLRIYHGLDRWSLRPAAQVVTVSRAYEQQLIGFGIRPEKIAVLHNAVDPLAEGQRPGADQLQLKKASLGLSPDVRVVLGVGRLSKEKAFPDLVAAVACLRKLRPELPVKLIIIGEGSERRRIEESIRTSEMQDVTTLLGHVRDVNPYYEVADVMVISSNIEGSPNVLLEAMAAEVPIVATAVGGIPEIVTDQVHAILVQPHDPLTMSRAIDLVLSDPVRSQELARAARNLAVIRYSPKQRAQRLIELYRKTRHTWEVRHPQAEMTIAT